MSLSNLEKYLALREIKYKTECIRFVEKCDIMGEN